MGSNVESDFPDLVRLFDRLEAPAVDIGLGRFCAQPVPGSPECAIGKDTSGNPVLLIQADNAQPGTAAPLVLEHLAVIHLVSCRIQKADRRDQDGTLSVVRCMNSDRVFHEYFLRSLHPVIASLPRSPSRQQISEAIERLVDLFRKIAQAPRKAIAGLWAELLVIARAHNPAVLLSCWHAVPQERFDFVCGAERMEVKAASGGQRIHHFSLEQLRPPPSTHVMIASVLVERAEGGSSVADLVDDIRSRISDPNMLIRLDSVVAQVVGHDWRSMQQVHFDLQVAIESFRFFDAASIPAVPIPLPPEVTEVHFRVDLTQSPHVLQDRSVHGRQMFRAAIPDPN
jgi:hypothetical protein